MPVSSLKSIERQKIQNFQDTLYKLSSVHLYIHKLQMQTSMDKKHYDDINIKPNSVNKVKVYEQRVGQSKGPPNLKLNISSNGTIMIYLSCSHNPFPLHKEHDVSDILIFLGRVEQTLHNLFSDPCNRVIPSVSEWILKGCDVNKDIDIDSMAQLTLPDIQISTAEKVFRGYVKLLENKVVYRVEQSLAQNEPVNTSLEKLRTEDNIDETAISL